MDISDQIMASRSVSLSLLGVSFLEQSAEWWRQDGVVCIFYIDITSFWRYGAVQAQQMCLGGLVQGAGTFWRHGGVDG
jgi:hypothetical protein